MKITVACSLLTLTLCLLTACKEKESQPKIDERLGELHFDYTCSDAARPHFERGLKLLHNFEYDDAREAFQQARRIDSTCVMAWWGEAMTHNHPLWRQQDREAAIAVLERLGKSSDERIAKAPTALEQDFLRAVQVLYLSEGEKNERDVAYRDFMETMYERYPGNEEVAAFYALSILGAVPLGRDEAAYEKSAAVAKGVLAENPNHPGALHYLIHSYDDPYHAHLALDAAQSYSSVAADATHALHMPSHIFLAVGMWKEVVASNIASYRASVRRMVEKGLGNDARSYHAFAWLHYGLLQLGCVAEAEQILRDMYRYTTETPSKSARSYFASMRGTHLLHTDQWDSDLANFQVSMDDMGIVPQAQYNFTEGWLAWHRCDAARLDSIVNVMKEARKKASLLVSDQGLPMCNAASSFQSPNQLDLDWAQVMELELEALQFRLVGNDRAAEARLRAAAELQSSLSYDYGPPAILKPAHEMLGEFLLEKGKAAQALQQFEIALERAPRRRLALQGKLAAAQAASNTKAADEARLELQKIETEKQQADLSALPTSDAS